MALHLQVARYRQAGPGGVTLGDARNKAAAQRKLVVEGKDPLEERCSELRRLEAEARVIPTFGEFADQYVETHRPSWRSHKHAKQWVVTLKNHAAKLRARRLNEVTVGHVLEVLTPLWQTVPETASRLRGRIENILDAAKVKNYRDGENPAAWKGCLKHLLPKRDKTLCGHHAALPWKQMPSFMAKLRQREEIGARLLEFAILTAARSGEARGVTWAEIDLDERMWTIPANRMKGKREHRVPLVARALEILELMKPLRVDGCDIVFANRAGKPFSDAAMGKTISAIGYTNVTQHGFRSSFSDWRAEATTFPYELAEMALAHKIASAVEAAYRRGDLFCKRVQLMQAWADHCDGKSNVVPIRTGVAA